MEMDYPNYFQKVYESGSVRKKRRRSLCEESTEKKKCETTKNNMHEK